MQLSDISLRQRERGVIFGGVDTGKSTLEEALVVDYYRRYLNGLILIADTKPRFRAEYESSGRSARARYKRWDHGPAVPGSVVITDPDRLKQAWTTGHRIAIAQADSAADIPMVVACVARFYEQARRSRPQLLVVDEAMDFWRQNGSPIGGNDAILRSIRAGRERGLGVLLASQRTRGIPAQAMEELSKLYFMRLDFVADAKRLLEMGAPPAILAAMPRKQGEFVYWTKADYARIWGPYKLTLPTRRRRDTAAR